jgi:hypothetical protein
MIIKGGRRKRHAQRLIAGTSFGNAESRTSAESLRWLIQTTGEVNEHRRPFQQLCR